MVPDGAPKYKMNVPKTNAFLMASVKYYTHTL